MNETSGTMVNFVGCDYLDHLPSRQRSAVKLSSLHQHLSKPLCLFRLSRVGRAATLLRKRGIVRPCQWCHSQPHAPCIPEVLQR